MAVAWCRLAHAPEAVIESAEIDCEAKAEAGLMWDDAGMMCMWKGVG